MKASDADNATTLLLTHLHESILCSRAQHCAQRVVREVSNGLRLLSTAAGTRPPREQNKKNKQKTNLFVVCIMNLELRLGVPHHPLLQAAAHPALHLLRARCKHQLVHRMPLRGGDASGRRSRVNLLPRPDVEHIRFTVSAARQQPVAVPVPAHLGHGLLVVAERHEQAALLRYARIPQLDLERGGGRKGGGGGEDSN